jgi:ATP adenylyltransferase
MSYVAAAGALGEGCLFCNALAAGDDRRVLILRRSPRAFLILNAFPYATGHVMAAPTRHVGGLDEASPEELGECLELIQQSLRALRAAYRPDGFNVGVNEGQVAGAGVPGHLHVHVVPRWNGDTNFMAVLGETKVIPEGLETTYDRLSAALGP